MCILSSHHHVRRNPILLAVYPSLVSESDVVSAGRRGQQNKDDDDELWTPQGCPTMMMLYVLVPTYYCIFVLTCSASQ